MLDIHIWELSITNTGPQQKGQMSACLISICIHNPPVLVANAVVFFNLWFNFFSETHKYGILEVDDDLRVLCMKEKPIAAETESRRAVRSEVYMKYISTGYSCLDS